MEPDSKSDLPSPEDANGNRRRRRRVAPDDPQQDDSAPSNPAQSAEQRRLERRRRIAAEPGGVEVAGSAAAASAGTGITHARCQTGPPPPAAAMEMTKLFDEERRLLQASPQLDASDVFRDSTEDVVVFHRTPVQQRI